jgi:hypothetical protein
MRVRWLAKQYDLVIGLHHDLSRRSLGGRWECSAQSVPHKNRAYPIRHGLAFARQHYLDTTTGLRSDGKVHFSPNFDRSGFALDLNVVYPIDRLHELAAREVIGSVVSKHLSFMGAQPDHTLSTIRLDIGPAATHILRDDGVAVISLPLPALRQEKRRLLSKASVGQCGTPCRLASKDVKINSL